MAERSGQDGKRADELPRLVSSNKVDGTPVLSRDGDRLGSVAAFLIDRFSGQTEYVIVTMGGVLGIGSSYHPIPWSLLGFDAAREGYVIAIDRSVLNRGPSFKSGAEPVFDTTYSDRISSYFGHS